MLIKLNIKRNGGSHIDLGGKNYHFAPNKNGDHVCDVTDKDHIKRFMSIDAYEPYESGPVAVATTPPAPPVGKQVGDVTPPPGPAVPVADQASLVPPVGEQTGNAPAGDGLETPPASAPTGADTYDVMDRAALATEVQRRTGKAPHHKTSEANLRTALRELDSVAAA